MSAITRGTRNAFRNPLRTISVTAILGISLGLVLVMLAARSAVDNRIAQVKRSVGNTVTVSPAGARGFMGGGEPLKQSQVDGLRSIANVTGVDATIDAQLRPDTDTSLKSSIEAGTLGNRQGRLFRGESGSGRSNAEMPFTVPIFAIGTNNGSYGGNQIGSSFLISDGQSLDAGSDSDTALVGNSLADKNSLKTSSTFTAYGKTITVSGIYDAGNEFANNSVLFPLKTLQRLSAQTDQVTSAVVRVDSVDHLDGVMSAVQAALGSTADVSSSKDTVQAAVKPLENIRTIATTSLIGALIAAAIITLLTMVMVVRERRKEIAVLKAIGSSDQTIITQFVTESVVLSLMGSVVGTVLGFVLSNPILNALVSSNSGTAGGPGVGPGPDGGAAGRGVRIAIGGFNAVRGAIRDLRSVVDLDLVLYGMAAAIVVAIIGSALPAWLIGRIRPAEVLRSE